MPSPQPAVSANRARSTLTVSAGAAAPGGKALYQALLCQEQVTHITRLKEPLAGI